MEALMQYVWQMRLWPAHDMVTIDGHHIEVVDPGLLNRDSGPDFFNAKIYIDRRLWVGNVEMHVKASDWFAHHHDTDKAYDSVVLHVVDVNDTRIQRSNGEYIPQMVMKCASDFSEKYHEMVNNPYRELPCGNEISNLSPLYIRDWLSALAFERLYAKADRIKAILDTCRGSWAEAIYITLARALGFSTNAEPFQILAQTTPLHNLLHHTDDPTAVEAILFGQAGMLDNLQPEADDYVRHLADEYRFYSAKYGLRHSPNIMWKMARMRPQNFPHRRIAALAHMICAQKIISNSILDVQTEAQARRLFDINLDEFWTSHYNFGAATQFISPKALSYTSVTVLLINVVIPIIFAYSVATGNTKRIEQAVDLLQSLKAESNHIIEIFQRANILAPDAFTTQAMIQLRRGYCEQRKCLYCRIGHKLLSQKIKRSKI